MYYDAGICITKVRVTSLSMGTLMYHICSFTIFYPCSSTFLSIHTVPTSVTFWINSTFIVISNVLSFSSRPLGIIAKVPVMMGITLASTFQDLLISLARSWCVHLLLLLFVDSCVSRHCNISVVFFVYNFNIWSLVFECVVGLDSSTQNDWMQPVMSETEEIC